MRKRDANKSFLVYQKKLSDMRKNMNHPWIARTITAFAFWALAFFGLILTDIKTTGAFNYWLYTTPIYGLLALGLSLYLRHKAAGMSSVSILHEAFHWAGLFGAILLVAYFVHLGILGRLEAALFTLTLLSLTTFLAGLYIEPTFLATGLLLGLFTAGVAFFEEYLWAIALLGLFLLSLLLIILYLKHKKP
jgi:hypothetical protein